MPLNRDVHAAYVEHTVPAGQQVLWPVAAQPTARPNEEALPIARDPDRGPVGLPRLASVGGAPDLALVRGCVQDGLADLAHAGHETARWRRLFMRNSRGPGGGGRSDAPGRPRKRADPDSMRRGAAHRAGPGPSRTSRAGPAGRGSRRASPAALHRPCVLRPASPRPEPTRGMSLGHPTTDPR